MYRAPPAADAARRGLVVKKQHFFRLRGRLSRFFASHHVMNLCESDAISLPLSVKNPRPQTCPLLFTRCSGFTRRFTPRQFTASL